MHFMINIVTLSFQMEKPEHMITLRRLKLATLYD